MSQHDRPPHDVTRGRAFGPITAWLLVAAGLLGNATLAVGQRDLATTTPAARAEHHLADGAYAEAALAAGSVRDDARRAALLVEVARQYQGARGGGAQADFDTLIELITSTVEPTTWEELGGTGSAEGFPGGVYVDTAGVLHKLTTPRVTDAARHLKATARVDAGNRDYQRTSACRKVSLPRLERALQVRKALGQPSDAEHDFLAGIHRVDYVIAFPESHDIVLAGPAGPWHRDQDGRPVNDATGEPLLQLDDLVVLLRNAYRDGGRFMCSIVPEEGNLRRTREFLAESQRAPLPPGGRQAWLSQLRSRLGRQRIEVTGIDPRTHVARVIVEADYHMKLIGMGLEPGVPGVTSYLDLVEFDQDGNLPPLDVLRWWFTLDDKSIATNADRDVFRFSGEGVAVLSENELLTRLGQRIHTGKSEPWNRQFATSFTEHFTELSRKYPIYAELRNVFDLALVAGVLKSEDLPGQIEWQRTYFGDHSTGHGLKHAVRGQFAPREVDTVVQHRQLDRRHFIAGVSGGVQVDTARWVHPSALKTSSNADLPQPRGNAAPADLPPSAWWWD